MHIDEKNQSITISKCELKEMMMDFGERAKDEYRYDVLLSLLSIGETLNGFYQALNDGIYFEEENDGELYASLLDKVNNPELYDGNIQSIEMLELRIKELKEENAKVKRYYGMIFLRDVEMRLKDIYGVRIDDKWKLFAESVAKTVDRSDYMWETINAEIDDAINYVAERDGIELPEEE